MKQTMYKKVMALAAACLVVNFVFAFSTPALGVGDVENFWGTATGGRNYVRDNSGLPSNSGNNDLRLVISQVIKVLLGFLGILAVIIVLYAGFKWMTAGGNEENVAAAKKILTAGLIGLVIILSAYALADFIITQIFKATTGTL